MRAMQSLVHRCARRSGLTKCLATASAFRTAPSYFWFSERRDQVVREFSRSCAMREPVAEQSRAIHKSTLLLCSTPWTPRVIHLDRNDALLKSSHSTAFTLFEGLWELGVTTCFVNVGSDHPSILEAIVKGKRERPKQWPKIITCPSEMTAISMADGHARVTGRPQAVIVHVDVGTQALAHGIHNASIGRVPVFIFAGLCPFTESGELSGSRTEYSNWLQDAPDQKAIVRQYCRYTAEIRTGLNAKQSIARALQFASSDPRGPVYLCAARETLAENIQQYSLSPNQWVPIGPGALPTAAVETIADALVQANRPLIITGYSGRNRECPQELVKLADRIPGLRVHDTGGSDVCFPSGHIASEGFRYSIDECTRDADVILLLDCDLPWIPSRNPPPKDARIYHVDVDPLNQMMPVSFFPAHGRWRADCFTALTQLNAYLQSSTFAIQALQAPEFAARKEALSRRHTDRLKAIADLVDVRPSTPVNIHNIGALLKQDLPPDTAFVIEAVTSAQSLYDQLQPNTPGSWINCGSTGIGWSNGAALGVRMAMDEDSPSSRKTAGSNTGHPEQIVCQVIGDGSYMCASPASAAWVAAKNRIPILMVVLNNGGWKAPRNSVQMVYPDGLNKDASDDELNLSFKPSPNYAQLAEAAAGSGDGEGWIKGLRVVNVAELRRALKQAHEVVGNRRGGILIEALMERTVS